MLYVPANRPQWFAGAVGSGADALILDLEDAVPDRDKDDARRLVASWLAGRTGGPSLFVRTSAARTTAAAADIAAVVGPHLAGVVVPKTSSASDVAWTDVQLRGAEEARGLPLGGTAIVPLFETALAMRSAFELASASPRVAYSGGIVARGGDVERALGSQWTPGGLETLYVRSRILLDMRAAGVAHPVSGVWTDVGDLGGLRRWAEQSRDIGYEGIAVIHPSHVGVVHEVFCEQSRLEEAEEILSAMVMAMRAGRATARVNGQMVDLAMAATAAARLCDSGRAAERVRDYEELRTTHVM